MGGSTHLSYRNPTGLLVGVDEICGLLTDGHHCYEIFGGKPWLTSAFRAWSTFGVLLCGDPYFECWYLLCLSPSFQGGRSSGEFSGGRRTMFRGYASVKHRGVPSKMSKVESGDLLSPKTHPAPLLLGGPSNFTGKKDGYLVDSASSHMLVSKIKPCMCKY